MVLKQEVHEMRRAAAESTTADSKRRLALTNSLSYLFENGDGDEQSRAVAQALESTGAAHSSSGAYEPSTPPSSASESSEQEVATDY